MKIYAMSDIHGYLHEFEYALSKTDKLSVTYDNLVYTDGMARRLVNELYLKRSK